MNIKQWLYFLNEEDKQEILYSDKFKRNAKIPVDDMAEAIDIGLDWRKCVKGYAYW